VAQLSVLEIDQILKASKQPTRVYARSLLCHWAIQDLRMTAGAMAELLGISQSAVTRAVDRGASITATISLKLIRTQNA
jgi:putative transposase